MYPHSHSSSSHPSGAHHHHPATLPPPMPHLSSHASANHSSQSASHGHPGLSPHDRPYLSRRPSVPLSITSPGFHAQRQDSPSGYGGSHPSSAGMMLTSSAAVTSPSPTMPFGSSSFQAPDTYREKYIRALEERISIAKELVERDAVIRERDALLRERDAELHRLERDLIAIGDENRALKEHIQNLEDRLREDQLRRADESHHGHSRLDEPHRPRRPLYLDAPPGSTSTPTRGYSGRDRDNYRSIPYHERASPSSENNTYRRFNVWKRDHGKQYDSPDHESTAYKNWLLTDREIRKYNAIHQKNYNTNEILYRHDAYSDASRERDAYDEQSAVDDLPDHSTQLRRDSRDIRTGPTKSANASPHPQSHAPPSRTSPIDLPTADDIEPIQADNSSVAEIEDISPEPMEEMTARKSESAPGTPSPGEAWTSLLRKAYPGSLSQLKPTQRAQIGVAVRDFLVQRLGPEKGAENQVRGLGRSTGLVDAIPSELHADFSDWFGQQIEKGLLAGNGKRKRNSLNARTDVPLTPASAGPSSAATDGQPETPTSATKRAKMAYSPDVMAWTDLVRTRYPNFHANVPQMSIFTKAFLRTHDIPDQRYPAVNTNKMAWGIPAKFQAEYLERFEESFPNLRVGDANLKSEPKGSTSTAGISGKGITERLVPNAPREAMFIPSSPKPNRHTRLLNATSSNPVHSVASTPIHSPPTQSRIITASGGSRGGTPHPSVPVNVLTYQTPEGPAQTQLTVWTELVRRRDGPYLDAVPKPMWNRIRAGTRIFLESALPPLGVRVEDCLASVGKGRRTYGIPEVVEPAFWRWYDTAKLSEFGGFTTSTPVSRVQSPVVTPNKIPYTSQFKLIAPQGSSSSAQQHQPAAPQTDSPNLYLSYDRTTPQQPATPSDKLSPLRSIQIPKLRENTDGPVRYTRILQSLHPRYNALPRSTRLAMKNKVKVFLEHQVPENRRNECLLFNSDAGGKYTFAVPKWLELPFREWALVALDALGVQASSDTAAEQSDLPREDEEDDGDVSDDEAEEDGEEDEVPTSRATTPPIPADHLEESMVPSRPSTPSSA